LVLLDEDLTISPPVRLSVDRRRSLAKVIALAGNWERRSLHRAPGRHRPEQAGLARSASRPDRHSAPSAKRTRRGSFRSVDELIEAVDHWSEHWNDDPKPFVWHRTAEEIIAKVRRGRAALDRVTKSAMHH
jgi:hypothetical protein